MYPPLHNVLRQFQKAKEMADTQLLRAPWAPKDTYDYDWFTDRKHDIKAFLRMAKYDLPRLLTYIQNLEKAILERRGLTEYNELAKKEKLAIASIAILEGEIQTIEDDLEELFTFMVPYKNRQKIEAKYAQIKMTINEALEHLEILKGLEADLAAAA